MQMKKDMPNATRAESAITSADYVPGTLRVEDTCKCLKAAHYVTTNRTPAFSVSAAILGNMAIQGATATTTELKGTLHELQLLQTTTPDDWWIQQKREDEDSRTAQSVRR